MISTEIAEAKVAWKYINGLVNIYKPPGLSLYRIRTAILHNLSRDLNNLEPRPLRERVDIIRTSDDEQRYSVMKKPNLADHVLATGPRYKIKDLRCNPANHLGFLTSGVMLLGLEQLGTRQAYHIRENLCTRSFQITVKLGDLTESNFSDTRVVDTASYKHVNEAKLYRLVASMQASHQRKMFELAGVSMDSQEGYELAAKGWIRPIKKELPVIYEIKCIEFKRPFFTLEVTSLNETEEYFGGFIRDMAIALKTYAHIVKLRCIRYGAFTVDTSLTRENWNLQNILNNMATCNKILKDHPDMLRQTNPNIQSF